VNQWRRVRSPYVTLGRRTLPGLTGSSWPKGEGTGFLNRIVQVRILPGTPRQCPRGRSDRRSSSKRASGRFDSCRGYDMSALAQMPHNATGVASPLSPGRDRFDSGMGRCRYLRERGDMGCRVMVTGRASKTRREGSIPSRPANVAWGDSSTGE
jgi:hypothetical protein